MTKRPGTLRSRLKQLSELARVTSVMMDGDEADRVITDQAKHYLQNPDPKHPNMVGDFYDVDHATFLRAKKTLLRLAKLVEFDCDATLWVKVGDTELTPAVRNGTMSRWAQFGAGTIEPDADLSACLGSGEAIVLEAGDGSEPLTAIAPVRDSLGDVVGLVEWSARHPAAKQLSPVWN